MLQAETVVSPRRQKGSFPAPFPAFLSSSLKTFVFVYSASKEVRFGARLVVAEPFLL